MILVLFKARRERSLSGVATTSLAIAAIAALHSLADLQISGFSMSVFALIGAGVVYYAIVTRAKRGGQAHVFEDEK